MRANFRMQRLYVSQSLRAGVSIEVDSDQFNYLANVLRMSDGAEVLARSPKEAAVSALAWNSSGALLMFGTEDGEAGTLDLT